MLFNGVDSTGKTGLWATDGTPAHTAEIAQGSQNGFNLLPAGLTPVNGYAIFNGGDVGGRDGLWTTDGTAAGTKEIVAGTQGNYSLEPQYFLSMGSWALFTGGDSGGQVGLWETNGKIASEIKKGAQGSFSLNPFRLTALGRQQALFQGTDSAGGIGIWTLVRQRRHGTALGPSGRRAAAGVGVLRQRRPGAVLGRQFQRRPRPLGDGRHAGRNEGDRLQPAIRIGLLAEFC